MTGKYLLLSTVHVTPETYYSIETMIDNDGFPAYKKDDDGYFIWAFPEEVRGPEDLCEVLYYAIENDCDFIILDSDGPIIDDLSMHPYSWEEFEMRD